ncbi:carbohydrate ABC transporter substrate-binding protein [Candidatus Woesearchaeota archaeon]|nr:MAG: carbohydrate ABC transporter substrate-binding protein [Candidatus Woesearchaeota archaeon]
MRKVLVVLLAVLVAVFALGVKKIVFWTAPNPLQEQFWKPLVEEWNKAHPDVQIEWSVIPAAGSSEEAILTALAAGRGPDISTNIFSGFAAQLAEMGAIVPLDKEFGEEFWALIHARNMDNVIKGWVLNGHYYVFPIYSNPMLFWWRKDLLKKYGYDKPPRTYSEIYRLAKKVTVPKERYAVKVVAGKNWWDRWFDFIMYYYAASEGKPYIVNGKAVFNNEYGRKVAEYIYTMFKNGWAALDYGRDPFEKGTLLGSVMGPWHFNYTKEHYPEVYKNILIAPPPVPDDYPKDKPVYTFADTKGLVMFSTCKYKKEAWEFIKWVFFNPQNDARWIEITKMPPARGDITINPIFKKFVENDPYFAETASYVAYAVPPALITTTIDVQNAMTNYLIEPLMYLKATPQSALDKAVKEINKILK